MPFGMKRHQQLLINMIITGLDNCKACIDDAIIYSEEWDQQIKTIREFFERLSKAKLTINLAKSEFCHANLTFLGHVVGQGQVKPAEAKVKAISDFPVPTCKRQLMRFLGMAGYYRNFCDNFSVIAELLTNLLSKRTKFIWTNDCQKAFDILKAILKNEPVLLAPNFAKEFKMAVDASDTGAGSVLMQEGGSGVDHRISYFSKKFKKHQKNYSTIEKECLSLILAFQHFEVYLTFSSSPTVVFSDHNPLIFIHKIKKTRNRGYSDGAYCYRNIILTSGTSKGKTIYFLMPCLEPDALISCNLLFMEIGLYQYTDLRLIYYKRKLYFINLSFP